MKSGRVSQRNPKTSIQFNNRSWLVFIISRRYVRKEAPKIRRPLILIRKDFTCEGDDCLRIVLNSNLVLEQKETCFTVISFTKHRYKIFAGWWEVNCFTGRKKIIRKHLPTLKLHICIFLTTLSLLHEHSESDPQYSPSSPLRSVTMHQISSSS